MRLFIPLLFSVLFLISSCVDYDKFSEQRYIHLGFWIDDIRSSFTQDQDTLRVDEIKFLVNRVVIEAEEDKGLESLRTAIFRYTRNMNEPIVVLFTPSAVPFDNPELYLFQKGPYRSNETINDTDFVVGDEQYSFVFKGTVNGEEFVYRSLAEQSYNFDIENVILTNSLETLTIQKRFILDNFIREIPFQTLLEPTSEDKARIDSLFLNNIEVSFFAENFREN